MQQHSELLSGTMTASNQKHFEHFTLPRLIWCVCVSCCVHIKTVLFPRELTLGAPLRPLSFAPSMTALPSTDVHPEDRKIKHRHMKRADTQSSSEKKKQLRPWLRSCSVSQTLSERVLKEPNRNCSTEHSLCFWLFHHSRHVISIRPHIRWRIVISIFGRQNFRFLHGSLFLNIFEVTNRPRHFWFGVRNTHTHTYWSFKCFPLGSGNLRQVTSASECSTIVIWCFGFHQFSPDIFQTWTRSQTQSSWDVVWPCVILKMSGEEEMFCDTKVAEV